LGKENKMGSQRPGRVQEALRQEISKIVHSEMKDPRIGFITITKVDLTKDLRYARIYFSILGEDKDKKLALRGLNNAKGYIKGLLADRIKLRFMPEIAFAIDESLGHAKHIYDILDQIKKERIDGKGDRGDQEVQ
jgi:ribosome-binding factor A